MNIKLKKDIDDANELTCYERNQSFNSIVSYLHSIRYRRLLALFSDLSNQNPGKILKVIDIGCAHAKTFSLLNERFKIDYLGIELNSSFSEAAARRYGNFDNFKIINDSIEHQYSSFDGADVIIALETLEHIPENIVVRIIEQIALAQPKAFICSVPNEVGPIVFVKNIGSLLMGYMRHKEYTWKETFYAGTFNLDKVRTHGTEHKGFDWRWLGQTIRHNMKITRTFSNPLGWLPKTLSVSVIFVCLRQD